MSEELRLSEDQLMRDVDEDQFSFDSTEELDSLEKVIGQERAVKSVRFGVNIDTKGYNIFALGSRGTGKTSIIQNFLDREAEDQEVPSDLVYVNNFDRPDQPRAIQLPSGMGKEFQDDVDHLISELKTEVPEAFDSEEYQEERKRIQKEFQNTRRELMEELESEAREMDFTLLNTPGGPMLAPLVDGEVMTPDQFSQLEDEKREQFEDRRSELQETQEEIQQKIEEHRQEAREKIQELDQRIIRNSVEGLIRKLREKYQEHEQIMGFLEEILDNLLENVDMFKHMKNGGNQQQQISMQLMGGRNQPDFDKYRVNLMVDHGETEGAPVVWESNPTYYNLLGRIEHEGNLQGLRTDFNMIKPGALHRANGGYLIVDAQSLLTKPFAWEGLKRALENEEIKTESMGQEYRAIQTKTLEPETIPLDITVVLMGNPRLYYLLYQMDDEFGELFKVKADFAEDTDFENHLPEQYAQFVSTLCEEEELPHFDPSGVARLMEEGIRKAGDTSKISTQFGELKDLVRQACYWAGKEGNMPVQRSNVQKAIEEQIYRSNRLEERVREMIDDGTIMIDTEGEVVGQINGLSVQPLGDYQFGKPTRITARTFAGEEGVVAIDREADLGGEIHNKGVLILKGYLGGEFALKDPLMLSASITFEQTYSEIDGDSASSTELYALLSSLSGVPIRQELAVTGSVNQHGEVQAIGGVNEKIEGFFQVCKQKGLTGDQGVLIPQSNVKNLMLRREVREAIENERFHIYPVTHVDQGIELLMGEDAGTRRDDGSYKEGTIKHEVQSRLEELSEYSRIDSGRMR